MCLCPRSELVKLPAGEATPIIKPLPSFPLRLGEAPIGTDALPHTLLLLDVQQVAGIWGGGSSSDEAASDEGSGGADKRAGEARRQLYCAVRLEPGGAGPASGPTSPASSGGTRLGRCSQLSSANSLRAWDAQDGRAAPVRTRALPPSAAGIVEWDERLCVALPMQPGAKAWGVVFPASGLMKV